MMPKSEIKAERDWARRMRRVVRVRGRRSRRVPLRSVLSAAAEPNLACSQVFLLRTDLAGDRNRIIKRVITA